MGKGGGEGGVFFFFLFTLGYFGLRKGRGVFFGENFGGKDF